MDFIDLRISSRGHFEPTPARLSLYLIYTFVSQHIGICRSSLSLGHHPSPSMDNFSPSLSHEANKPMISKVTRPKLHCLYNLMKLLHKCKKAKRRGHTTNANDHTSKPFSDDRLEKAGEKGVIRVKVVLTKEEAARLLSICVRGEEKTLTQLMSQLESRHTGGVTLESSHGGWRPGLESIPEDC